MYYMNLVVWRDNLWMVENFTLYKCLSKICSSIQSLNVVSERVSKFEFDASVLDFAYTWMFF